MLVDHHLHLENGTLTVDNIACFWETARARGASAIGFSEHGYNFRETLHLWPRGWNMDPPFSLEEYVECVLAAARAGLPVKLGIEMDFLPERKEEIAAFLEGWPWDYVIGSVHHLGLWGFDHPDQIGGWQEHDTLEAYQNYFHLLNQASVSGLFDIMAHPDVIKVFGYRPHRPVDHLYRRAAEAMARGRVAAEINTAGWRKPAGEVYPAPDFLDRLHQQGVPLVISSDAHYPEDCARDFPRALDLARAAGYDKAAVFQKRRRRLVDLPESA